VQIGVKPKRITVRHMNHGPRFWDLVREFVGDVEKPQAWLSKNGPLLHRCARQRGE